MSESKFRTIEISDPRFEAEGLRWVTVKSGALGQRADLTLFVPGPASVTQPLPVVILLHGVYGSHWAWSLKGGAHRTAARLIAAAEIPPMLLAMPSDGLWGDGSGYLPHQHQDFEQWILGVRGSGTAGVSNGSPLFINGLSMGGFGALRLAGKYPERFTAAGGHSSMTHFDQFPLFVEEPLIRYQCAPEDKSVLETLLRSKDRLPPLRFDCGTEDQLIEHNRELSRELTKACVPHVYEEYSGGHSWPYWENHLSDMLRFFAARLKGT